MGDNSTYEILSKVIGVGALILTIIGTIGNFLTFLTCLRKRLRSVTTFVFFAFMAINDIFSLYCWNLSHFVQSFFKYYHYNTSLEWCRISAFVQNVSLEWSAWLLVTISVERYFSIIFKTWRTSLFSAKKAAMVATSVGLVLFILHFHMFITNGIVEKINGTTVITCYESKYENVFPVWLQLHGYLYSIIPFSLILITNSLLVYKTTVGRSKTTIAAIRSASNASRLKQMGITILIMTFSFIVMTLPAALAGGYFYTELSSNPNTRIIINFCDLFSFGYHSLNFAVLLVFNKQFRSEWKVMITGFKNMNKVDNLQLTHTFTRKTVF